MANTVYITAGLPVAKNSGQSPSAGVNTVYVTAGLPPVVEAAPPAGVTMPQLINRRFLSGSSYAAAQVQV